MNTKALSVIPGISSLDAYIHYTQQIPMLTQVEEEDLLHRLHTLGDVEAARRLVLSHLRYVVKVARGYSGYGLALGDLIQEGNVGLMKAVKRFDPSHKVRLVSFAIYWIKAEIHDYVIRNWRIVKVATTKAQRKLFFNLRRYKKQLSWLNQDEIQSIASDLGVKPSDVKNMEQRLQASDAPFDEPRDDEHTVGANYYLASSEASPEQAVLALDSDKQQNQSLEQAISALDKRSRDIIQRRWLDEKKATLQQLAKDYEVSAERIRQLEQQALQRLRGQMA